MNEKTFDILIVGGGLSGLLTALALSKKAINIGIIDKNEFSNPKKMTYDKRTTAIAEGSKTFIDTLDIWKKIEPFANPIRKIRVFDRDELNKIDFIREKSNSYLGYIVENQIIKKKLVERLSQKKNINFINNSEIQSIDSFNDYITSKTKKFIIKSKLLIAADGKNGFVKKIQKTNFYEKKYKHKAIVINLIHEKNHKNIAYEIFYKSGPLALLPVIKKYKTGYCSSLVWSNSPEYIDSLQNLDDKYIKLVLEEKIKNYIGNIYKILDVKSFNLSAHINSSFYNKRLIYIGDSAHSIHPIAGQGWNLGVRDIENLSKIIDHANDLGIDIGSKFVCKEYQNKCFYDAYSLYQITDKLNSIFLYDNKIINKFRNIGFNFINKKNKLNNIFSTYAMGYRTSFFN